MSERHSVSPRHQQTNIINRNQSELIDQSLQLDVTTVSLANVSLALPSGS